MLSDTIKSQLVNVKAFLDRNGIDTSYLDLAKPASGPSASAHGNPEPRARRIAFPAPTPLHPAAARS